MAAMVAALKSHVRFSLCRHDSFMQTISNACSQVEHECLGTFVR
jgi:hypothetical protein